MTAPMQQATASGCVRSAWLNLNGVVLALDNPSAGYFCTKLDLGSPTIRAVENNRPDHDGSIDGTQFLGSRLISADITALASAGAQIDAVAASFAPYMAPSARPVLHYVLDRPGEQQRTITLRGSAYAWPIVGPFQRDIQLQWVAADPVAYDSVQQQEIAWAGSSTVAGRAYNLGFDRIYPVGSMSATNALLQTRGDLPAYPLVRIYGPVTGPSVMFSPQQGGTAHVISFLSSFILGSNQWVDIDNANHTILRQSFGASVVNMVDWSQSSWLAIAPLPATTLMMLHGSSTTSSTQAQAMWHDGYLT